ncbi:MAG: DUF4870 domain-containing protein [Planctomycetota bacterium]
MQSHDETRVPRTMTENEIRQWTMSMHIGLLASYVLPVLGAAVPASMWFMRRNRSERVDRHGEMLMNAALCIHGALVLAFALSFFIFGMLPFFAVMIAAVVLPCIGALKANDGELWRYPLVRDFVRLPGRRPSAAPPVTALGMVPEAVPVERSEAA